MKPAVSYCRVSTLQQGRSGLGLEVQRETVAAFAAAQGFEIIREITEVESGKHDDRPRLAKALDLCRTKKATLIIAKLDRLSRNARFLLSIVEGSGPAGVAFCDLPQVPPGPMGKFFLTLMAAVAELEGGMISQRTKAAMAAAKARGTKLGNPDPTSRKAAGRKGAGIMRGRAVAWAERHAAPLLDQMRANGITTLREQVAALNARGSTSPSGRPWTLGTLHAVSKRLRRAAETPQDA